MKKILTVMLTLFMSITLLGIKVKASSSYTYMVTDNECPGYMDSCYVSIEDAISAMNTDNDTHYSVYLDKDIDVASTIVVENVNISINTHGHKITNTNSFYSEENNTLSLFSVRGSGSLYFYLSPPTINSADVALDIYANDCHVVDVQGEYASFYTDTKGNLKSSSKAVVYVKQGHATISGGTIETELAENASETLKRDEKGGISVRGGWFVNYDPSEYIPDGSQYTDVTKEDNTYVVGKHTITLSAGEHGKIIPSGEVVVAGEEKIPAVIDADDGYVVNEELVDGEVSYTWPSDTNASGVFTSVNGKESFSVNFRKGNYNQNIEISSETDTNTAELEPTIEPTTSIVESILNDEEINEYNSGSKADVKLTVKESTDQAAKDAAQSLLSNSDTVGIVLDISLKVEVNGSTRDVTETNRPISIEIKLPEELKTSNPAKVRNYTVIRVHNGVPEVLYNCPYNPTTGILTINTDKFSDYLIAYEEKDRTLIDALDSEYYFNGNYYDDSSYKSGLHAYIFDDSITLTEEENNAIKEGKDFIINYYLDDVTNEDTLNDIKAKLGDKNFISAAKVSAEFGIKGSELKELTKLDNSFGLEFSVSDEYLNEDYQYYVYKYTNGKLEAETTTSNYDYWTDDKGDKHYYDYESFEDTEFTTYVLAYKKKTASSTSTKKAGKKDLNSDGIITCDEEMGGDKNWTWSEARKACVYKVMNTSVR